MIEQFIEKNYGLKVDNLFRIQSGVGGLTYLVEANSEKYVLKGADYSDNYIVNEPEIALFLRRNGIPVTEYVLNKDNKYLWIFNGSIYHLQRFVEGEVFAFHEAPDWFMEESAQLLGKIHSVLLGFRRLPIGMGIEFINHIRSDNPKISYERTLEISRNLHDEKVIADVEYRLSQVNKLHDIEYDLSKFTCCNTHGDFKISQIICGKNQINAIIDWTGACIHPICWEIIRSFTYADSSCVNGEIDIERFIRYVKIYLQFFVLNKYDLKMMPYFFYHQLLACDYYGQYYASTHANREDLLFQALFATKLIRWFENNVENLSKILLKTF